MEIQFLMKADVFVGNFNSILIPMQYIIVLNSIIILDISPNQPNPNLYIQGVWKKVPLLIEFLV